MSQYAISLTSNNSLSSIGSYRILSYSEAFTKVSSIQDITDVVTGETSSYHAQRSFRYSKDGTTWSLWINFTPSSSSPENMTAIRNLSFDPDLSYWFEFRYLIVDDDASPALPNGTTISPAITVNQFDVIVNTQAPLDPYALFKRPARGLCSNEFSNTAVLFQNKNYCFDPYNIGRGVALYQDLSNMVNNVFGFDTLYWRVTPQQRSKDIVFKEWTLYHVQQEKCLKLLVPNNEFPDSKPSFNNFGIDFEQPFEVHIDKGYWESFYGVGTMPQKRDIVYFKLNNRIYEVSSTYTYRDFMQQPLYFKVSLVKYQPKADTLIPNDIETVLDDITISTEELFGEDMKLEIEKVTKPQQYVTITHDSDPIREKVLRILPIDKLDLYNNWTLVAEHSYNLTHAFIQMDGNSIEAIRYRIPVKQLSNEGRAFTCWFNPAINTKTSDKTRSLLKGRNSSGLGVDIDLIFSTTTNVASLIVLTINANIYTFSIQKALVKDNWYSVVVNWSNEFLQASVDVYVQQEGNSALKKISHEIKTITEASYDTDLHYTIMTSPMQLTNIRLFKEMIEEEHHSIVLNQLIVKDSDKAIIIDNAKPLLRIPRIANPK